MEVSLYRNNEAKETRNFALNDAESTTRSASSPESRLEVSQQEQLNAGRVEVQSRLILTCWRLVRRSWP